MEADERAWVDGLRRGEPAAFDGAFAAYKRRIYAYLLRMTRRNTVPFDSTCFASFKQLTTYSTFGM